MTVTNFNLLPGGVSRESLSQDASLNERFLKTVLESMKLLLNASLGSQEVALERLARTIANRPKHRG